MTQRDPRDRRISVLALEQQDTLRALDRLATRPLCSTCTTQPPAPPAVLTPCTRCPGWRP